MFIGDKQIVFLRTFVIPNDDTLEFSFSPTHPDHHGGVSYNKAMIDVRLRVSSDTETIDANWKLEGGKKFLVIRLPPLKGNIGPGMLTKPIVIAEIANKTVAFFSSIFSMGGVHLVTLQFMYGGKYE